MERGQQRIEHVGVDGCRLGWVAVYSDVSMLRYRLFRHFDDLVAAFADADRILVDIPIGLPWEACPVRPCDSLARRLLGGGRASSVFPAPSRAACGAGDIAEARRLNLREVGRSLSAQTWSICSKVAEVDDCLLSSRGPGPRVHEIHPEICFWGLNAKKSMQHSKGTRLGIAERLAVLLRHAPRSESLLQEVMREQRRKDIQPDDVLDALAAYVTAAAKSDTVERVIGQPARDSRGLPMEMLYVAR